MRQRDRVSRGSRYGKANKLDMAWGEAGERQKCTSVRLTYETIVCQSNHELPPPPTPTSGPRTPSFSLLVLRGLQ